MNMPKPIYCVIVIQLIRLWIISTPVSAAETPAGLSLIGSYVETAGSNTGPLYRVIFRNDSSEAQDIRYLVVPDSNQNSRSVGEQDPDVFWWRVTPAVVPQGGYGELRIKMKDPKRELSAFRVKTALGLSLGSDLPKTQSPLRIHSVKYSYIERAFYCYWSHTSESSLQLQEIYWDGVKLPDEWHTDGRVAPKGTIQCLSIPVKVAAHSGEYHLLSLRTENGVSEDTLFRVQPPFQLGLEDQATGLWDGPRLWNFTSTSAESTAPDTARVYLASCLTHQSEGRQASVWSFLRKERESSLIAPNLLGVLHICHTDQADGLWSFSRASDVVRVNPYLPFSLPNAMRRDWEPAFQTLQLARFAAGSGAVYSTVLAENAEEDDRVWARTLLAIASGCSGVSYRMNGKGDSPVVLQRKARLEQLLDPLRSTLPLWDSAEVIGKIPANHGNAVLAWLVQMGPRRLAVVMIDSTPKPELHPVTIKVPIPESLHARRVLRMDGSELATFKEAVKGVEVNLKDFKDGTVVFIELEKPKGLDREF